MKKILPLILSVICMTACAKNSNTTTLNKEEMQNDGLKIAAFTEAGYKSDSFTTPKGRNVNIVFIKHGSIVLDVDGYLVYIDPVTMFGNDFAKLPKADMILVTHEHHDHFDPKAIEELSGDDTTLTGSVRINELYGKGNVIEPGQTEDIKNEDFTITATPAYNITPDHLQFHPKDRKDVGFVFDIDGMRIYVAGDTEDIPEMADLKDIDVAFLPVNQPYTMTPQQAIHAVEMIKPKIFYPYHYGQTDLSPIVEKFKDSDVEVRVRSLE